MIEKKSNQKMKKSDNLFKLRTRKFIASFKDHWHMTFRSAAHNHLRLQKILRDQQGDEFCTLSFCSYTALKQYQKKTRVFGMGLTTGLAVFLVALVLVPAFLNPRNSQAAITVTWNGSVSTDWATAGNWVGGAVPGTDADVIINGSYTNAPTLDLSAGSVTINSLSLGSSAASVLTVANGNLDKKLIVNTNVAIGATGTLTHSANTSVLANSLSLQIGGDLTIATGGKIDLGSKGFVGRAGNSGYGPGAGTGGSTAGFAGGAAYGGNGGSGTYVSYIPGVAYGSIFEPVDLGSSGGSGGTAVGGSGGGSARIVVAGIMTINGSISSNGGGGSGSSYAAGGSGGSVWLTVGTLAGGGSITANGGASASSSNSGGGGGGRISISYNNSSFTGTKTAFGGLSATQYGGAGTIYTKQGSSNGDLLVDNNSASKVNVTPQGIGTNFTFDNVSVIKAANYVVSDSSTLNVASGFVGNATKGNLIVNATATLNFPAVSYTLSNFLITNDGTVGNVKNLTLSSSTFNQNGTFSAGLTDLTVGTASIFEFQNLNTTTSFSLNNLTVLSGGTVTHKSNLDTQTSTLNLNVANNLDIQTGGKIDVSGKGFAGRIAASGYGPGAGGGGATSGYAAGAAYGGDGGKGSATMYLPGVAYGDIKQPTELGSSGGSGGAGTSGAGGGNARIVVAGNMTVNGVVSSNGSAGAGSGYAAGGSGGSIWVTANTLAGSGSITANGGNPTSGGAGGGGGGGRISIEYTSSSFSGTKTAFGGSSTTQSGGAGTIYTKQGSSVGDLLVDSNNQANGASSTQVAGTNFAFDNITITKSARYTLNSTSILTATSTLSGASTTGYITVNNGGTLNLPSATYTLSKLEITNDGTIGVVKNLILSSTTLYQQNGTFSAGLTDLTVGASAVVEFQNLNTTTSFSVGNITIQNGGVVTHKANVSTQDSTLNLNITNNLDIQAGGKIDVSGKGFAGKASSSGYGPGAGTGGATAAGGGGGSYGGKGGNGNNTYVSGSTYGSITEPTDLGSAGGTGSTGTAGAGGGSLRLVVGGTLTMNGLINSNGTSGVVSGYSAGGSGGSIWITTGTLAGNGPITANGGNAYSVNYAGGGGGGRISIGYTATSFTGTYSVAGGTGKLAGEIGTVYVPKPVITSVIPSSGSTVGGDSVVISGSNFYGTPSVKFGAMNSTSVTLVNGNTLNVISPANVSGSVDVTVTNPDGISEILLNGFVYEGLTPSITSVSPAVGPIAGGTSVTIDGNNFSTPDGLTKFLLHADGLDASFVDSSNTPKAITAYGTAAQSSTQVKFGNKSAYFNGSGSYLSVDNSTDFDFGSGDFTVDWWEYRTGSSGVSGVISRNTAGYSPFAFGYSNNGGPEGVYLTSNGGSWDMASAQSMGNIKLNEWSHLAVVRSGNNFYTFRDGALVSSWTSSLSIASTTSPLVIGKYSSGEFAGYIDELRISKGIARWTANFTPEINPYILQGQPEVFFGGTSATSIDVVSKSRITAITPAHAFGNVDVVVKNDNGQSYTLTNGFSYTAPPSIDSILPTSGFKTGGDLVTITGANFYGTPTVKFGTTNATNVTVVNPTTITATTPAHLAGLVSISVTNPDNQSATSNDAFLFNELEPVISSISPVSGPAVGGTRVAISGSNFIKNGIFPDQTTFNKVWYVSVSGSDSTGDGSLFLPFASVKKAVETAASGDAIKILPGTYRLTPVDTVGRYVAGYGKVCLTDNSKNLAFFGSNGDTVLECYGSDSAFRDAPLINLGNDLSVVSNLKFNYYPNNSANYSNAIFGFTNGTFYNIFVENKSTTAWSYSYDNDNKEVRIYNSIFKSNGHSNSDYSGNPTYTNCLFDAIPSKGIKNYSLTREITANDWDTLNGTLPADLIDAGDPAITDPDGTVSNIGAVGGKYYWSSERMTTVKFGELSATDVFVVDTTKVLAKTPAHVAGTVDVTVTNYDNQSDTLASSYTFVPPATLTAVNPSTVTNNQSKTGILISGTGFQSGATLKFKKTGQADVVCSNVTYLSDTSLSCDADFHGIEPGSWNVEITNADAQISTGTELLNVIGEVTQIKFQTPSYTVRPDVVTQAIRIQLLDNAGRVTKPQSDTTIDLSKTSATGEFSLSKTSWSPINSISFTTADSVKTIYYKDSTSGNYLISASENPSLNWTDASQDITVSLDAPYVWPFDVASDYTYDNLKVEISNSDANLTDLSASGTEIKNTVSAALTYSKLTSFSEVLDVENQGYVKYQLSNDDGTTWYWWNGSSWVSTMQESVEANDATTINEHISVFNDKIGQIGNAKLSFRAFMISDGNKKVSLDSIFVGYRTYPYKYVFTQKPETLNQDEIGTFTVQAQDQNGNVIPVDHDTVVSLATTSLTTGFFATDLGEDVSTRWDKQSIKIAAGQSSAKFYYKDVQKGKVTVSVNPPAGEDSLPATHEFNVISKYRFLVTGVSDPVKAGVASSVTIQAMDYLGNVVTNYAGTVSFSSTDPAALLPSNSTLTLPMLGGKTFVNGVTLMTEGESCVTVKDVSDSIVAGSQCNITVDPAPVGVPSKLKFTTDPQNLPLGEVSSPITVQLQDVNGDPAVRDTATTVYIYRTTPTGLFSADGSSSWTSGAFSLSIPAKRSSVNFFYKDSVMGTYNLTAADENTAGQEYGLTNDTQQISVGIGEPHSFSFNEENVQIPAAGTSGPFNFSLHDPLGNQAITATDQPVVLTSNNGGEFSLDGLNGWSSKLTTSITAGNFDSNFYYRNNNVGTDQITISDTDPADGDIGIVDVKVNFNVVALEPAKLKIISDPWTKEAGERALVTVQIQDDLGNPSKQVENKVINLSSDNAAGVFTNVQNSPIDTVTVPADNSQISFYYQSNTVGVNTISVATDVLLGDSQTFTAISGDLTDTKLETSSKDLVAGLVSNSISVSLRNSHGIEIVATSDFAVNIVSNSVNGRFSTSESGEFTDQSLSLVIPAGSSNVVFYYKDTKASDVRLSADGGGFPQSTLDLTISADKPDHLAFTSASQNIVINEASTAIAGNVYDQYGNISNLESDLVLDLGTTGTSGEFSLLASPWSAITSLTMNSGQNSFSFFYKDPDMKVVSISVSSSLGSISQNESIIPQPAQDTTPNKFLFQSAARTMVIDSSVSLEFYLASAEDKYAIAQDAVTATISSDSATGLFFDESTQSWKATVQIIFQTGETLKSVQYKDSVAGNPTITISADGLTSGEQQQLVVNGSIEKINIEAQDSATTIERIPVTIKTVTNGDMPVPVSLATHISLTQSGSGKFFASASSLIPVSSTTLEAGTYSKVVYYQQTTVGEVTLTADEDPSKGWTQGQKNISIYTVPTKLNISTDAQTKEAGQQSDIMTVRLEDEYGNVSNAASDMTLHLSSSSQFGEFSILPGNDWSSSNTVVMQAGSSSASFYYRDTLAGIQTITVSDISSPAETPDSGFDNATQKFTVTSSAVFRFKFLTAENNLEIGQVSSGVTVQAQDQYGNAKVLENEMMVYLYSTSASAKFSLSSDFSETGLINSVRIPAGSSAATFRYRDMEVNEAQIIVSDKKALDDPDVDIVNASQQVTVITGEVAKIAWEKAPGTIEEGGASDPIVVKTTNSSGVEIPVLSDLTVYFTAKYTSEPTGAFDMDGNGSWDATSTVITAGSSRATFQYKDSVAGSRLLIVSDEAVVSEYSDSGLQNASGYMTIVKGAITNIAFGSSVQTISANNVSGSYQIQTLSRYGIPTKVTEGKLIYLRSSSKTGEFSFNGVDWGINGVIIEDNRSSAVFYYRDAISGTYTLTASDTLPLDTDIQWVNATQTVTVVPQQLDHFSVRNVSDPQKQGTPSSVVVSPVDAGGYVIKEYAGTLVGFKVMNESGELEDAVLPDVPYTFNPIVDKGIKTFVNGVAFYQTGEKFLSVVDDKGFTGMQEDITVMPSSTNPIAQVRYIDTENPLAIAKKTASPLITVQTQDAAGEPKNATSSNGYDIKIVSSSDSAEFSTDGKEWKSTKEIVLHVKQFTNFATFYYRNSNKVNDELVAMDWEGGIDDSLIDNDKLNVKVIAGDASYLEIAGNSTQIAGTSQNITITAKDEDGDIATSYAGKKNLILSGASIAYTGEKPECQNNDEKKIAFGEATELNFIGGKAACTMTLYKKETAEVRADDGGINSFTENNHNLKVEVGAAEMAGQLSILNSTPNPQKVGAKVSVFIIPKDRYGNLAGATTKQVLLNIARDSKSSKLEFSFEAETGKYKTEYVPQEAGVDLLSATLNGAGIKQDTEGESDGIIKQVIEGTTAAACNYLNIDEDASKDGKLVFNACIATGKSVKSSELSRSDTQGTSVFQLGLDAASSISTNFSGKVEIGGYTQKPTDMELPSQYQNSAKYIPYVFLKTNSDDKKDKISRSVYRVIISSKWMSENSIKNMLVLSGSKAFEMSKRDSTEDSIAFEITLDSLPEYMVIMGEKNDLVVIDDKNKDKIKGKDDPIIIGIKDKPILDKEDGRPAKDKGKDQDVVSKAVAKLFHVDPVKANEITNMLALISTGAAIASVGATTAASLPMLSYMLGAMRTVTALPYRRKQKWGVVYDSQSGKPLVSALVIIMDENGKVKEMKNTDQSGFYSFLAPQGKYVIDVKKYGYVPAEHSHVVTFETYYDSSYICGDKIELEQEEVISLNIPMIKQDENFWRKIFNPSTMTHIIFWIGFLFSIFALVVTPNYINAAILIFFIISFVFNAFYKEKLQAGKILNKEMKPIGFASVKIFDKSGENLLARTVANERGSYVLVMNEGEYIMEVQSGETVIRKEIALAEHGEIRETIIIG